MITFCFDRVADQYYGYPNIAKWSAEPYTAEWQNFDQHWPYSVPLRLLMYFRHNHIPYQVTAADSATHAWYPIAFGWFDFTCDYINLISPVAINRVKQHHIKILFYYHEGDNPKRIKERLDYLCKSHALPDNSYIFISANSAAENLAQCIYFPDHEFFFRHLNRQQTIINPVDNRSHDFTLLSRTHKWWRATCVADLVESGILDNSLWSYNTDIGVDDQFEENPIEIDSINNGRTLVKNFVDHGPYRCDESDQHQQNDHHRVNDFLYTASNIHIILETHFDADQSGGTFITEKTYKAIKYGQPFVVVGPPGTLARLKKDGYRTFDAVIDSSYDAIIDNTARWHAVKTLLMQIKNQNCASVFKKCRENVDQNQQMFLSRSTEPLNTLKRKLLCLV
jgi:hypothetical protein